MAKKVLEMSTHPAYHKIKEKQWNCVTGFTFFKLVLHPKQLVSKGGRTNGSLVLTVLSSNLAI